MGIFNVDLDKINVDDVDFNKDETGSRIYVRLAAWCNRFKQKMASGSCSEALDLIYSCSEILLSLSLYLMLMLKAKLKLTIN